MLDTDAIRWNVTKFLVDRDGEVLRRQQPTVLPEQIGDDLEPPFA